MLNKDQKKLLKKIGDAEALLTGTFKKLHEDRILSLKYQIEHTKKKEQLNELEKKWNDLLLVPIIKCDELAKETMLKVAEKFFLDRQSESEKLDETSIVLLQLKKNIQDVFLPEEVRQAHYNWFKVAFALRSEENEKLRAQISQSNSDAQ